MRKLWLFCGMCLILSLLSCQPFETKIDSVEQTSFEATEGIQTTESTVEAENLYDYVLNTNTKKFHNPNCYTVEWIKETNRQEYHGTKEELASMGYDNCGICNP